MRRMRIRKYNSKIPYTVITIHIVNTVEIGFFCRWFFCPSQCVCFSITLFLLDNYWVFLLAVFFAYRVFLLPDHANMNYFNVFSIGLFCPIKLALLEMSISPGSDNDNGILCQQ